MTDTLIKYKRIIAILSGLVVCLIISNYYAYNKLNIQKNDSLDMIELDNELAIDDKPVIIDDFGYRNDSVSDGFLNLNVPITCAIIPGHSQSRKFAEKASAVGKEVIIHMPMESNINTKGEEEYKIRTGMTSEEIEWRIREVLKDIPEAVGMNNHQGSRATADGKVMSVVASVLKRNDKYFIDSRTTGTTVAEKIMREIGVPTARRHVFLDNDDSIDKIAEQLNELVTLSRTQGVAIAIGHAKSNTLKVLKDAIPQLVNDGYEFEFASQVVD